MRDEPMFYYVESSLLESPAQTLVNTVNTVGAMGKGLAFQFKRLLPDMFRKYQILCESGELEIGKLWLYTTPHKWVLNFPTKKHWRSPSQLKYIESGLKAFVLSYESVQINSIAFPRLGCGNGELSWVDVRPLMEQYLKRLPIDVYIHERTIPIAPEHKNIKFMREWLMSEPRNFPFIEFETSLKELIGRVKNFRLHNGEDFTVELDELSTTFSQSNSLNKFSVPFVGDESGVGWLDIWQSVRTKGRCTVDDLESFGIADPKQLLSVLSQLPFVTHFKHGENLDELGIQLKPLLPDLSLFKYSSEGAVKLA